MQTEPQALCSEIADLVKKYDERLGDVGRGHQFQLEEIILIVRKLRQNGFVPYQTPGKCGADGKYITIYASSGMPTGGVWFGFVRGDNSHSADIVAFEVGFLAAKEFQKKTGITFATAIEGAY